MGGELFTKAIADAMTVSVQEAENMKVEQCAIPDWAGVFFRRSPDGSVWRSGGNRQLPGI